MTTGRFDKRLAEGLSRLSVAEQRLAREVGARKERAVLASAQQIAAFTATSDATVLRMVRGLGYDSLAEMREDLLADLTGSASPAARMEETLSEAGSEPQRLLAHVVQRQEEQLAALRRPELAKAFDSALGLLSAAQTVHVFGLGPSGAMADYLALQLSRMGLPSRSMTESGVGLAGPLTMLRPGDLVVMIAYAPIYREVKAVLDRAEALGLPVLLISDSLGPYVEGRVACLLDVPRGRAQHLALHSATMVMIEALALGFAARNPDRALDALDEFATLRAGIDGAWAKRGTRRRKSQNTNAASAAQPDGETDV